MTDVTQADRQRLLESGHPLSREAKEQIESGEWDHHHLVQAFAAHRLAAITACQSGIREECAKVADQEADKCNEYVAAGVGGPDGIASNMTRYRTACNIAQAIRSMKP